MTLTEAHDPAIAGPASRYVFEHQHASLVDAVEQLAALRFSVLLAAKWENAGVLSPDAGAELRDELRLIRIQYNDKIDEIAMNYGVTAAMAAKEGVEREVTIPKNMMPPVKKKTEEKLWF